MKEEHSIFWYCLVPHSITDWNHLQVHYQKPAQTNMLSLFLFDLSGKIRVKVQMFSSRFSFQDTAASENMCGNPSSCNSCSMLENPSLMSLPGPPTILRAAWCLHHSFYSALLCCAEKQNRPFRVTYCQQLLQVRVLVNLRLSFITVISAFYRKFLNFPERQVRTFFSISVFI